MTAHAATAGRSRFISIAILQVWKVVGDVGEELRDEAVRPGTGPGEG